MARLCSLVSVTANGIGGGFGVGAVHVGGGHKDHGLRRRRMFSRPCAPNDGRGYRYRLTERLNRQYPPCPPPQPCLSRHSAKAS